MGNVGRIRSVFYLYTEFDKNVCRKTLRRVPQNNKYFSLSIQQKTTPPPSCSSFLPHPVYRLHLAKPRKDTYHAATKDGRLCSHLLLARSAAVHPPPSPPKQTPKKTKNKEARRTCPFRMSPPTPDVTPGPQLFRQGRPKPVPPFGGRVGSKACAAPRTWYTRAPNGASEGIRSCGVAATEGGISNRRPRKKGGPPHRSIAPRSRVVVR